METPKQNQPGVSGVTTPKPPVKTEPKTESKTHNTKNRIPLDDLIELLRKAKIRNINRTTFREISVKRYVELFRDVSGQIDASKLAQDILGAQAAKRVDVLPKINVKL